MYREMTQQKLTKQQGKAKKCGEVGRHCNKTTACPSLSGLPSVCISSPHVLFLSDSELQRHSANGKLSPGAKVEAGLAASGHSDSASDGEYFTDTL